MRMRLKKHLDERIDAVKDVLLRKEVEEFYKLTDEENNFVVNLAETFENDNPVHLELGCGKGAFAIQSAVSNPNINYLALEKLTNVIVVGCENAQKLSLNNLKFLNCRAENLLCYLPPHTIDVIHLNFSCPFPKKTYANRRLTSKNFLNIYKELLKPNGIIVQKTDDINFFKWSLESYGENGFVTFDVSYDLPNDSNNVVTEYEQKFRQEGKKINYCKAKLK